MPSKRILCVDDDENICLMLVGILELSDLEAVSASDAGEALRLIAGEQFSLYILDRHLTDIAEPTLCQQIRAQDKETPLIILSGESQQSEADAEILAGANAYILKPDLPKLIATVKQLLEAA